MILLDGQNIFSFWRRKTLAAAPVTSDDYTIVVPIYGHPRYFTAKYELKRARTLVAIDVGNEIMADFADELERQGWRVHRAKLAEPGPPGLINDALQAGAVTTKYTLRMDADTYPLDDVGAFISMMDSDETDMASCVMLADRTSNRLVQRFQELEYRMAMRSRRLRPWLTSGACFISRTDTLKLVLAKHSFWFPGEDVETGRVAKALGYRVRHLDLRVKTEIPPTWRSLHRQRKSWWAGGFRHAIVNIDKNFIHMPIWTIYYSGIVTLGVIVKLLGTLPPSSMQSLVLGLVVLYVFYVALTFACNMHARSWLMFGFPPYALFQAVAMPILGAFWFVIFAIRQRRLGRYGFGYRRRRNPRG